MQNEKVYTAHLCKFRLFSFFLPPATQKFCCFSFPNPTTVVRSLFVVLLKGNKKEMKKKCKGKVTRSEKKKEKRDDKRRENER